MRHLPPSASPEWLIGVEVRRRRASYARKVREMLLARVTASSRSHRSKYPLVPFWGYRAGTWCRLCRISTSRKCGSCRRRTCGACQNCHNQNWHPEIAAGQQLAAPLDNLAFLA